MSKLKKSSGDKSLILLIIELIIRIIALPFILIAELLKLLFLGEYRLSQANIDSMDGHDFEHWCASVLRRNGYQRVEVTRGSGDQGVDIIAYKDGKKYAIQCKRYKQKLGNKPIQEVHTGKTIYHCDVAAVMTNNYFTPGAIEAARAVGVLLWDRDTLTKMLCSTERAS